MMKKMIATLIIFLAIVCSSIFSTIYTTVKFNEFSKKLNSIASLVELNNWQVAQLKLNCLIDQFDSCEKKLQIFLNRTSLEEIDQNLTKLKTALVFEEKPQSAIQILKLQNHFKRIAEDELPLFRNIL